MEQGRDDRDDGFHQRLGFGKRPAVVVVDMCKAYFTPESPLFLDRPNVVGHCRDLVETARALGHRIWWTRVEIPPDSNQVFRRKVGALSIFAQNHPWAGWLDELVPDPGEAIVTKQNASAFFATDLADQLRHQGVDTVVIAGVSTSGCVRATALDACQHNFVPIVVADACGDRTPATQAQNLADLDAKYADVEPIDRVLAELRRLGTSR